MQSFPKLFMHQKLPTHICFKKSVDDLTQRITLQPILCNQTIFGDRHFDQLRALIREQDALEKMQGVTSY